MEQISMERMEIAKEETEKEMKAVSKAIEKAQEILDILPIDSQARVDTKKFIGQLEIDEEYCEQIIQEYEQSVDFYSY